MLALLLFFPIAFALSVREILDTPIPKIPDAPARNVTAFAFPTAHDWFTLNATNYILWDWAQDNSPDLRVILDRPDGDVVMLRGPLILNDKIVYASSENFEIKVAGSDVIVPMPWGVPKTAVGSGTVRMGSGAAPAVAQTSTIDIVTLITQGLVPSTAHPSAASTEIAGESPLTSTRISFPTMLDWWVLDAPNQAEWTFVHPTLDPDKVEIDLILDNLDDTLCPSPVLVARVHARWGKWGSPSNLQGAKPDIYAESENFELRPAGAAPTHEWDSTPNVASVQRSAPAVGPTGSTSGARRLATPEWLGVVMAAVVCGTGAAK
ncbi:hypothetical protein CspHIS471_0406030 [Cutaneotrichosporon sp. HIS471]|nr:hypothetical protein CspHIS471_0406030 [Cutaneotrichosporon sp. HIS471]